MKRVRTSAALLVFCFGAILGVWAGHSGCLTTSVRLHVRPTLCNALDCSAPAKLPSDTTADGDRTQMQSIAKAAVERAERIRHRDALQVELRASATLLGADATFRDATSRDIAAKIVAINEQISELDAQVDKQSIRLLASRKSAATIRPPAPLGPTDHAAIDRVLELTVLADAPTESLERLVTELRRSADSARSAQREAEEHVEKLAHARNSCVEEVECLRGQLADLQQSNETVASTHAAEIKSVSARAIEAEQHVGSLAHETHVCANAVENLRGQLADLQRRNEVMASAHSAEIKLVTTGAIEIDENLQAILKQSRGVVSQAMSERQAALRRAQDAEGREAALRQQLAEVHQRLKQTAEARGECDYAVRTLRMELDSAIAALQQLGYTPRRSGRSTNSNRRGTYIEQSTSRRTTSAATHRIVDRSTRSSHAPIEPPSLDFIRRLAERTHNETTARAREVADALTSRRPARR